MGVGQNKTRNITFINLDSKAYKFVVKKDEKHYDFIEGYIEKIDFKEDTIKAGTNVTNVRFHFRDNEHENLLYILCINYNNGAAISIINFLASIEKFGVVNIGVWKSKEDDFPRISAKNNGAKLSWKYNTGDFPKSESIKINNQVYKSRDKQMEFFKKVVEYIQNSYLAGL